MHGEQNIKKKNKNFTYIFYEYTLRGKSDNQQEDSFHQQTGLKI